MNLYAKAAPVGSDWDARASLAAERCDEILEVMPRLTVRELAVIRALLKQSYISGAMDGVSMAREIFR
jgi:hypothetical protein